MKFAFVSALAALTLTATGAQAAKIIAPVSVTATKGGSAGASWSPEHAINQNGLQTKYTAGVTDFDAYMAGNPFHDGRTRIEYLSSQTARSAQLTFDFGEEVTIYKLAIWDADAATQQSMSISTPEQGLLYTFSPVESQGSRYAGQVFEFRPITTRYLSLDINGCGEKEFPQQTIDYCGLGEIIFADGTGITAGVPEPATWAMMILGFGAAGSVLRRRSRLALA
jgi:hypothetical protein